VLQSGRVLVSHAGMVQVVEINVMHYDVGLVLQAGRADLIETDVKEALSEASAAAAADAKHRLERLEYIIARLNVIKEKEVRGNPDGEVIEPSMSLASVLSLFSYLF
jgi:hypothetical protein